MKMDHRFEPERRAGDGIQKPDGYYTTVHFEALAIGGLIGTAWLPVLVRLMIDVLH